MCRGLPTFRDGQRERLCNLGWLAGLSTMCSLVAQWKIVGGTRRLAHWPAGGDPVCCNHVHTPIHTHSQRHDIKAVSIIAFQWTVIVNC